jgi:hypothetical protein
LPEYVEPTKLSETGLYLDLATEALGQGVRPFEPRFALWSDGATKRRYAYLPPCSQIDTSEPDFWRYPIGTKLWKEFSSTDVDGNPVRVETRLIQKYSKTKWFMASFVWNEEQTDALRVEGDGPEINVAGQNLKGTQHDVPGQKGCDGCHYEMADKVLGFSALQLDREGATGEWTLQTLLDEGWLTQSIATPITLPGTEAQQNALGYMHANCGTCHQPYSQQEGIELRYWLALDALGSVEETPTYITTVGQVNKAPDPPADQPPYRIAPKDPAQSSVYWRMTQPPTYPETQMGGVHMPLIGTEVTDQAGVALVEALINSLDPVELPPVPAQ